MEHVDRLLGAFTCLHFNKTKPSGTPGVPVSHHRRRYNRASLREQLTQILICR